MDAHFAFTVLACILMVGAAVAEENSKQDTSQDLKTAGSSRFLNFYGGGRYPSNGGYGYPNPNYSYHYYPNTGFGSSYPSYNYPHYGNGGYLGSGYPGYQGGYQGGYPGGYPTGYPGWAYSAGFGNGYSSGFGSAYSGYSRYKTNPDLPQLTTANGGYIYKR